MADYAGIFAMLAMGALVVGVLLGLQRSLAPRAASARTPERTDASEVDRRARSGPETRLRVGFLFGGLVFLVVAVGLIALVPWGLAARVLGTNGLVAFLAFTVPLVLGLLHAASRGALEW